MKHNQTQLRELITGYGKIDTVSFDRGNRAFRSGGEGRVIEVRPRRKITRHCRKFAPLVVMKSSNTLA